MAATTGPRSDFPAAPMAGRRCPAGCWRRLGTMTRPSRDRAQRPHVTAVACCPIVHGYVTGGANMTNSLDPEVPPSGTGCVECLESGGWWLHLRRCTECGHIGCCDNSPSRARDRSCELVRSPCHLQLRARRGLVLELPNKRVHRRASPRTPAASSPRPTSAWTSRTGPRQLASPFGGIVTTPWVPTALGGPQVFRLRTVELGPPGPAGATRLAYRFANFLSYSTPMDVDDPR